MLVTEKFCYINWQKYRLNIKGGENINGYIWKYATGYQGKVK